ncbi:MAG: hypothetical protein IPO95_16625 [Rhodanobacteraceae bacterium]|nr:hypothetical protein [Rhodanobacteraceae bacterium]
MECTFKNEAKELFLARMGGLARQIRLQKNAGSERQRLDGILGSVGDGVFGVDAQGVTGFCNRRRCACSATTTSRPRSA